MTTLPTISVVIPALNEEKFIANTLKALRDFVTNINYEVIVVDNGSTDNTREIAKEFEAKVLLAPEATISKLRNEGVKNTSGEILVFIDADVCITQKWADNIIATTQLLQKQPDTITGSRCLAPQNNNWLNKYWFNHLNSYESSYINSGHLITTRSLFNSINGFSENLRTAEDYDFCHKAKKQGAEITPFPDLEVIHYGYPETIKAFIRRERWHGREDFETYNSFLESKVAWAATFNSLLLIIMTTCTIYHSELPFTFIYLGIMCLICTLLSKYKYRSLSFRELLPTAVIFYFYLTGRSLSLMDRIISSRRSTPRNES